MFFHVKTANVSGGIYVIYQQKVEHTLALLMLLGEAQKYTIKSTKSEMRCIVFLYINVCYAFLLKVLLAQIKAICSFPFTL